MKKLFFATAVCIFSLISKGQTYILDKNHTKVGFSVSHFGISNVEGQFKDISATMTSKKEDFTEAVIEMTANVNSIDTDNDMRDKDLKSENWFDANKYPTLIFKSTSFKKTGDKTYKLNGNITIRGVTKPITFDVIYNGKALNPMSKKNSVGFTITGKLNRKDFQVGSGAGSSVVGDEVDLRSNSELIID
ncbi:MAG: YceI family protein [Bacteroidota bacterium]